MQLSQRTKLYPEAPIVYHHYRCFRQWNPLPFFRLWLAVYLGALECWEWNSTIPPLHTYRLGFCERFHGLLKSSFCTSHEDSSWVNRLCHAWPQNCSKRGSPGFISRPGLLSAMAGASGFYPGYASWIPIPPGPWLTRGLSFMKKNETLCLWGGGQICCSGCGW